MRRVDQRDVGQRLREISGLTPRNGIIFLGQQTNIVRKTGHAIEQGLRLVEVAREHMGIRFGIVVCEPGTIPRSEGKAVRVVDRR